MATITDSDLQELKDLIIEVFTIMSDILSRSKPHPCILEESDRPLSPSLSKPRFSQGRHSLQLWELGKSLGAE